MRAQFVYSLLVSFSFTSLALSIYAAEKTIDEVKQKTESFWERKAEFNPQGLNGVKDNTIIHSPSAYPDTPVCVVDGSFIYSEVDLSIPLFGIGIQRIYRSLPNRDGVFGPGWKFGYQMRLYPVDHYGFSAVAIERADGRIIIFRLEKSGFVSPFRNRFRLAQTDGGTYILTELGIRRFFFDEAGRLVKIERRKLKTLEFRYDEVTHHLIEIYNESDYLVGLTYNDNGHIESIEDYSGRRFTYYYDTAGRLVQVINPLKHKIEYQYGEDGYLRTIIDKRGNPQIELAYMEAGKVKSYTRNGELYTLNYLDKTRTIIANSLGDEWTYSFLPSGLITQIEDAYGNTSYKSYDGQLRLVSSTNKRGATVKYFYDDAANTVRTIDPLGNVTTHIYRDGESITKTQEGRTITRRFDNGGNLVEENVGDGEKAFTSNRYIYNESGHLVKHIDSQGNTTQFEYDTLGNLVRKVDAQGHVTRWQYDQLGRTILEKGPLGRTKRIEYDLLGRVRKITQTGGETR